MASKKETMISYCKKDDEVHIQSYDKKLNKRILKLKLKCPRFVDVVEYDGQYLNCFIQKDNFGFRLMKPIKKSTMKKYHENGIKNKEYLKNK